MRTCRLFSRPSVAAAIAAAFVPLLATAFALCQPPAAASPPPLSTSAPPVAIYYSPDTRVVPAAAAVIANATSDVHLAASTLTDPAILAPLEFAATAGKNVTVCLNLSGGTAKTIAAHELAAAGVTVYSSTMTNSVQNHFITADTAVAAIGTYYWSPTAQQIGSWLATTTDPAAAAACDARFATLCASGTLVSPPASDPLKAPPETAAIDDSLFDRALLDGFNDRPAMGRYRNVTLAVRQLRADLAAGRTDAADRCRSALGPDLAPNPQRACRVATFAVMGLEMAQAFGAQIPPQVIQEAIALQKQLCTPTPAPTGPISPIPAPRPRQKHLTGASPTPHAKLRAAPKFVPGPVVPPEFSVIPSKLSYWGNDKFGDCVSAESAAAKLQYSVMTGQPPLLIPDSTLVNWASSHRFLNGADLTEVMDAMASDGITVDGRNYKDGPYRSVDWTDHATLCAAIAQGPVKIGVAAGQLQDIVNGSNGWVLTGATRDERIDHAVNLCGYGSLAYCCSACGVSVPPDCDPAANAYCLFTWSTIGVIDEPSMVAITGEAWLRTPTTVGAPPPVPVPVPVPTPTPTTARVWFSPHGGAQDQLCAAIALAQTKIRVLTYTDTNVAIFAALVAARNRGVDVQIVADPYCAKLSGSRIAATAAAGVPVLLDSAEKIQHNKVTIIDDKLVYTGSFNYSAPAESANAENLVLLTDPDLVAAYVADWQKHASHSVNYHAAPTPADGPALKPPQRSTVPAPPTHSLAA